VCPSQQLSYLVKRRRNRSLAQTHSEPTSVPVTFRGVAGIVGSGVSRRRALVATPFGAY